jgi:hypothetical protein
MALSESELLIEKSGFIQCQIEVGDFIEHRYKEITARIKILEEEIKIERGLISKQKKVSELCRLSGQAVGLKDLLRFVQSLKYANSSHSLS